MNLTRRSRRGGQRRSSMSRSWQRRTLSGSTRAISCLPRSFSTRWSLIPILTTKKEALSQQKLRHRLRLPSSRDLRPADSISLCRSKSWRSTMSMRTPSSLTPDLSPETWSRPGGQIAIPMSCTLSLTRTMKITSLSGSSSRSWTSKRGQLWPWILWIFTRKTRCTIMERSRLSSAPSQTRLRGKSGEETVLTFLTSEMGRHW